MEYVSFVILHYKDYSVTDTCVRSILAMEQQERIRIVIVDNVNRLLRQKIQVVFSG